jgi:photosystem II stability/assembly factor-like uncharacterized protein
MTSNTTAVAVVKPPRIGPTGGGPFGGIVTALAVDPAQSATVYAGTYGGGVFKSTDGGGSWSGINTGLTDLEVKALTISPANSAVLYAGTNGGGVFRSLDGGGSWTAVNDGLTSRVVRALAVSPTDPRAVYAGTSGPLFKSIDGGQSWLPASTDLPACSPGAPQTCVLSPFAFVNVYSIAIDPSNPAKVYAGTVGGSPGLDIYITADGGLHWGRSGDFVLGGANRGKINALAVDPSNPATVYAGTDRGLLKTGDGGTTWTIAFGAPSVGNPSAFERTVLSLAIDPGNPSAVYAGTLSGGVYKSLDGAGTWQETNSGIINTPEVVPYPVSWWPVNSGATNAAPLAHIWSLAIDPNHSSTVYAGSGGAGPLKTTDGGQSWTLIRSGFTAVDARSMTIHPAKSATIYAGTFSAWTLIRSGFTAVDARPMTIHPAKFATIYTGTFGAGIFKSTDAGRNWVNSNSNLTGAYSLVPGPGQTVYATELCCGLVKTTDGGKSWERDWAFTAADPLALAIDPSNPSVLYAGDAGPNRFGLIKSTDGGKTWTCQVGPCPNSSWTGGIVLSLAIDPFNPSTLFIGAETGVFKTTDGGQTVTLASSGLSSRLVFSLAIDPSDSAVVYAGTSRGVFKTTNSGQSWTDLGLSTQLIYTLVLDWSAPSTIYAGTDDGGVFKSTNGGRSWTTSGSPTTPVQALAIDPTNPLVLYAATRGSGVLQSTDGGVGWLPTSAHP